MTDPVRPVAPREELVATARAWWKEFDAAMQQTIETMASDDDAVATFDRIGWLADKLARLRGEATVRVEE